MIYFGWLELEHVLDVTIFKNSASVEIAFEGVDWALQYPPLFEDKSVKLRIEYDDISIVNNQNIARNFANTSLSTVKMSVSS